MNKFVKLAAVAATVLATTPALAAPVGVTGAPPTATARIIRPLSLTSTGSLNFGTIVLNGVSANRTVALSSGNVLDCGAGTTELQCSGATSVPTYNVRGTNNQVVTVIKTATNLTNCTDGSTLSMTPTGAEQRHADQFGRPGPRLQHRRNDRDRRRDDRWRLFGHRQRPGRLSISCFNSLSVAPVRRRSGPEEGSPVDPAALFAVPQARCARFTAGKRPWLAVK